MMAEKAAKDVYEVEAFIQYDESVVDQEDVLRFFSCDNMKKKKLAQAQAQPRSAQVKKNKYCLRYNEGTCTAKNCQYAHRCLACDDWNHAKKDCKNVTLKKKDTK